MPLLPRLVFALVVAALCSGCAGRTASIRPLSAPAPQSDVPSEEKPEPLPPGVKPLTVEQEEMMSQ
jgi:hypothetical protein